MIFEYQEKIDLIENCPNNNEVGDKILYRCVENPMSENSFIPNAVLLKPKHSNNCLAWGLSLFNNYNSAKEMLNNLSKNKQVKYSGVAKSVLTDLDGIKHCGKNKKHYTFYPKKDLDILSKFAITNE